MSRLYRGLVFGALSIVLAASVATAQTYTSIDYPGAVATEFGGGPNPEGAAVGSWLDTASVWHGFVWKEGVFTAFDFPGTSTSFAALWITPQEAIVGSYYDQSGVAHGFTLNQGQYTTLDYPGAAGTLINGANTPGENRRHELYGCM